MIRTETEHAIKVSVGRSQQQQQTEWEQIISLQFQAEMRAPFETVRSSLGF